MAETLTTKLEAVNSMLRAIGESPINSITVGLIPADVQTAIDLLNDTSRAVQLIGWSWNCERNVVLIPALDGTITLPGNCLECKQTPGPLFNDSIEIHARGLSLYDKKNHTYAFTVQPNCDVKYYLSWDELPEAVRHYVKIKAARTYQDGSVGSDTLHSFTEKDELAAWSLIAEANSEQEQATIFDNWTIGSIFQSRRRPMGS